MYSNYCSVLNNYLGLIKLTQHEQLKVENCCV
jgi:hypothetical protein